jgi:ATP/maltotriose-dependent transcriptional regulator MalT
MTKPSDHDVHPRDQLVAEIFDTLDDNLQEAFLERASIIEFDSNLPRAHAECLAMICILNRR